MQQMLRWVQEFQCDLRVFHFQDPLVSPNMHTNQTSVIKFVIKMDNF